MSVDPTKLPPLAQSTVGDVEIVCCLSCCPTWFGRSRTPKDPSSPPGFNPKLAPVAKAIVEEVHRQRVESNASRRPSVLAVATGIVEEKKETEHATHEKGPTTAEVIGGLASVALVIGAAAMKPELKTGRGTN
jgi:hypothetical protein